MGESGPLREFLVTGVSAKELNDWVSRVSEGRADWNTLIVPAHGFTCSSMDRHYNDLGDYYREIWGKHLHHGLSLTGSESRNTAFRTCVTNRLHPLGRCRLRHRLRLGRNSYAAR